jgi:thiol oxidase
MIFFNSFKISDWNGVVAIGAVDCAKPENNPLCRDVEIMSYPTLRVFPPMAKDGELGSDLKAEKTVASITGSLLDFIEKEQLEGKGGKGWPTLIPYRYINTLELSSSKRAVYYSSNYIILN